MRCVFLCACPRGTRGLEVMRDKAVEWVGREHVACCVSGLCAWVVLRSLTELALYIFLRFCRCLSVHLQ